MAAYFIDLDGTILQHSTQIPLPGALEYLNQLYRDGHQIIFTTWRGNDVFGKNHPTYSQDVTLKTLKDLGIVYHDILFGIESPRVVVNDDGCHAVNRKSNQPWE